MQDWCLVCLFKCFCSKISVQNNVQLWQIPNVYAVLNSHWLSSRNTSVFIFPVYALPFVGFLLPPRGLRSSSAVLCLLATSCLAHWEVAEEADTRPKHRQRGPRSRNSRPSQISPESWPVSFRNMTVWIVSPHSGLTKNIKLECQKRERTSWFTAEDRQSVLAGGWSSLWIWHGWALEGRLP